MSLTRAEKLKKRSNPFFEPPMAVIGSKPPEAILKSVILAACTAKILEPDLKSRTAVLENRRFF